jgi:hypothetical protein
LELLAERSDLLVAGVQIFFELSGLRPDVGGGLAGGVSRKQERERETEGEYGQDPGRPELHTVISLAVSARQPGSSVVFETGS